MYKFLPVFFYHLLYDLYELEYDDLVFIDDSRSKLESAIQNGINGVSYKHNEQVMEALIKIGWWNILYTPQTLYESLFRNQIWAVEYLYSLSYICIVSNKRGLSSVG